MPAEDIFDVTKINYGGLDEGEVAFAKAYNDMVTVLDQLERDLLAKSAIWQGQAKTVFDEVRQLWDREANDMSQFIELILRLLLKRTDPRVYRRSHAASCARGALTSPVRFACGDAWGVPCGRGLRAISRSKDVSQRAPVLARISVRPG